MNKIVQAAGRCIRSETDKGVILFMDNRYLWPLYAQSFPKHYHLRKAEDLGPQITRFFSETE